MEEGSTAVPALLRKSYPLQTDFLPIPLTFQERRWGRPREGSEEDGGAEFALSRAGVFLELALLCLQGSWPPEPACSLQGTQAASPTHPALLCAWSSLPLSLLLSLVSISSWALSACWYAT